MFSLGLFTCFIELFHSMIFLLPKTKFISRCLTQNFSNSSSLVDFVPFLSIFALVFKKCDSNDFPCLSAIRRDWGGGGGGCGCIPEKSCFSNWRIEQRV